MSTRIKIKKLFSTYWWFICLRGTSFFIVGFETFFGPKIIGLSNYGEIEFEKQVINLAVILLLGVHSGFGFNYFKHNKTTDTQDFFVFGFIHSVLIFIITSLAIQKDLLSFGIVFFLLSVLIEQLLKIRGNFNIAILYKPILSILLIAYYVSYYFFHSTITNFRTDLNSLYLIALVFFITVIPKGTIAIKKTGNLDFRQYISFLEKGFEPNLSSSFLLLFLFIDRYIIKEYYSSQLGIYSVAHNFAYISFLLAGSIAYVTTVKFGERMNNDTETERYAKRLIKISLLFVLGMITIIVPLIYITSIYWYKENGFLGIAIINLVSKTILGATTIVSPVIFYRGKERYSWMGLLAIICFVTIFDSLIVDSNSISSFWIIQIISGVSLIGYSIYLYYVIKKVLKINLI